MRFEDLFGQKREMIKQRWIELIIETYPAEARDFFRKQKNPFSNPVGAALTRLVDVLCDALCTSSQESQVSAALNDFVKVRAVQEFAPSEAVAFILSLKQAIRETLSAENPESGDLVSVESRIDGYLLDAFDSYMESREKLYRIRADELKRQSFVALQMMNSDCSKRGRGDNTDDK